MLTFGFVSDLGFRLSDFKWEAPCLGLWSSRRQQVSVAVLFVRPSPSHFSRVDDGGFRACIPESLQHLFTRYRTASNPREAPVQAKAISVVVAVLLTEATVSVQ